MGALTLIQSGFLGEGLTGFLRSSGWRILLLLCIVTFYQVVITLCKGEVDSITFGTFMVSSDTSDTANISNDGLEGEYYLDLSQRSIKPVRLKVYHSSVGV